MRTRDEANTSPNSSPKREEEAKAPQCLFGVIINDFKKKLSQECQSFHNVLGTMPLTHEPFGNIQVANYSESGLIWWCLSLSLSLCFLKTTKGCSPRKCVICAVASFQDLWWPTVKVQSHHAWPFHVPAVHVSPWLLPFRPSHRQLPCTTKKKGRVSHNQSVYNYWHWHSVIYNKWL